ncbi:MAG TPA: HAMP domain-containing sensor histidine kinase [Solirubrobacteraceae bacterium]|nr:HAMP domain-containing sensor histidine kinase [Solirubrobacteraceae bacterium]
MSRLTLRARVAAAAGVAIVVGVVVLGIAVLARLDDQLRGDLDRTLRQRAVEVARLSASTPKLLTAPGALEGRLGGSALFVQVVDRRDRLVARSGGLGGRVLPEGGAARAALHERRAGYGDDKLGTDRIRVYAAPLGELGQGAAAGGAVIVAGTTSDIEDTLATTRRFVVLSAIAAALLAVALATVLAGRALRPLRQLSSGARAIERTGDASRRLAVPAARDEVGDLAETLNAMLASLERARETERRFVGDASHELRTPLTALRGNAAYVARHGADPAALADLEADAARLSALLDDLLALAREDAAAEAPSEHVDLVTVARAAASTDPGPTTIVAPGPGEVVVLGERAALERAVGNLVRNARKHGPPDGAITIAVEGDHRRARLSVTDEGKGLDPSEAARAFERFWRGPNAAGEGSGLGLAIVRSIAERHDGRVEVDGARFTIDLPALKDLSNPARRTRGVTVIDHQGTTRA